MRLANNIVVHDPETNIARIDAARLHAHGWADEVVQEQLQRSQRTMTDVPSETSSKTRD